MRSFTATFFLIALAENLLVPGSGGGLTIYRIGGSDMDPPPEAGMEGVEFVPLSWERATQGFDGQHQIMPVARISRDPPVPPCLRRSTPARRGSSSFHPTAW